MNILVIETLECISEKNVRNFVFSNFNIQNADFANMSKGDSATKILLILILSISVIGKCLIIICRWNGRVSSVPARNIWK